MHGDISQLAEATRVEFLTLSDCSLLGEVCGMKCTAIERLVLTAGVHKHKLGSDRKCVSSSGKGYVKTRLNCWEQRGRALEDPSGASKLNRYNLATVLSLTLEVGNSINYTIALALPQVPSIH